MSAQRTPGPWFLEYDEKYAPGEALISAPKWGWFGRIVVRMADDDKDKPEGVANAAFIVEACNAHDDLVRERDEAQAENARLREANARATTALKAWEQWEADIIINDDCWMPEGMAAAPTLTTELWERVIEMQALRNAALTPARQDEATPSHREGESA